jgi:hypothetical protein
MQISGGKVFYTKGEANSKIKGRKMTAMFQGTGNRPEQSWTVGRRVVAGNYFREPVNLGLPRSRNRHRSVRNLLH